MTGDPQAAPCFSIFALGDVSTGVYALAGITAALLHRERSGRGQYLDLALLDAYLNGHEVNVQAYSASRGAIRPIRSGSHHYAVAPLGIYAGTRGYFFIVALPHQWPAFCQALGQPELLSDPRFDTPEKRVAHVGELTRLIEGWLQSFGDDEVARRRLEAARVPIAPVLSIEETVHHPHHRERRSIRTIHDRVLGDFDVPGMPLRFSEFPDELPLEAPFLGEHNLAILSRHLGCSADEVAALERAGVLGCEPVPPG
jgi:crotonobetainyl-CoA:carnitine CoA-transferase CaiB-like acyl-CoA transferase